MRDFSRSWLAANLDRVEADLLAAGLGLARLAERLSGPLREAAVSAGVEADAARSRVKGIAQRLEGGDG